MHTEIVFPFLNFFLFLFLLFWFSRKPVRAMLEKKRLLSQLQLEAAELAARAAEAASLELQEKTKSLEGELQKLRGEADARSRVFTEEALARGALLSQKIAKETQEMMDAEFLRAQAQLQTDLLSLVEVAVVEKIRNQQGNEQQKKEFSHNMQTVAGLLAEGKL